MSESTAAEFVDFNDIRVDIDSDELEELIRSRIDTRAVDANSPVPDFNTHADEHQKGIIRTEDECIRVVGPPGTGKTQTLVNRILGRISAGAKPERILMLTFDNPSAILIREQIVAATARPGKQVAVATLNAYGYSLLREFFPSEHRPVASPTVCNRIARGLLSQLRAHEPAVSTLLPTSLGSSYYVALIGLIKNAGFDPRAFKATELARHLGAAPATAVFFQPGQPPGHRREILKALAWIFQHYDVLLARSGNIDFDDQKLRALACLKASSDVLESIQSSLDEVIVDDFQDVSSLDFALISIVSRKGRLVVAGDDDQAIYGFRGCTTDFLIDFEEHCGRTPTFFELKASYRCPGNVAAYAARSIAHNSRRIPKNPVTARQDGAPISIMSSGTAAMEAKALAAQIAKVRRQAPDLSFCDIVVFYGSNAQSLPLQVEFILNDIPYQVRSQDNIVESGDLAKLLSIVRLKLQGQDEHAEPVDAWNCIRSFYRLPADAEERLFNLCTGQRSFAEITRHPEMATCLPNTDLGAFHDAWAALFAARTLRNILDIVAAKFSGIGAMTGAVEDVMENGVPLGEIFGMAATYNTRPGDFVKDLGDALDKAAAANFGRHQDGVALLTYPRAKGRQWHTVMIAGVSEGILPRAGAPIEDERRLFYVAMTRPSSNLIISSVGSVCRTPVATSRFVAEAGLGESVRVETDHTR